MIDGVESGGNVERSYDDELVSSIIFIVLHLIIDIGYL
jgi:hypothetical protein